MTTNQPNHIVDSFSAATLGSECASIWTFHSNRNGLRGAVRCAIRRVLPGTFAAFSVAVTGVAAFSLASSPLLPSFEKQHSPSKASTSAIYIQQGEAGHVAQSLQQYVNDATISPGGQNGRLLAFNVDDLNGRVRPELNAQPEHLVSAAPATQNEHSTASAPFGRITGGGLSNGPVVADTSEHSVDAGNEGSDGSLSVVGIAILATYSQGASSPAPGTVAESGIEVEPESVPHPVVTPPTVVEKVVESGWQDAQVEDAVDDSIPGAINATEIPALVIAVQPDPASTPTVIPQVPAVPDNDPAGTADAIVDELDVEPNTESTIDPETNDAGKQAKDESEKQPKDGSKTQKSKQTKVKNDSDSTTEAAPSTVDESAD